MTRIIGEELCYFHFEVEAMEMQKGEMSRDKQCCQDHVSRLETLAFQSSYEDSFPTF